MKRIYLLDFESYAVGFKNGIFKEPEFVMVNLNIHDALVIFLKEQTNYKYSYLVGWKDNKATELIKVKNKMF